MNPGLETLIGELEAADRAMRIAAARQLASLGEIAAPAAVALVRCSGDAHEELREWAVAALEECGPPRLEDAAALAAMLGDAAADVAYWAATLLGRLGDGAETVIDPLMAALSARTEPAVRQRIVWALGEIGMAARRAIPLLESIVAQTDDARLQRLAERALREMRE